MRVCHVRCRANMAHTKQAWPDCGFGFQVTSLKTDRVFRSPPLKYSYGLGFQVTSLKIQVTPLKIDAGHLH